MQVGHSLSLSNAYWNSKEGSWWLYDASTSIHKGFFYTDCHNNQDNNIKKNVKNYTKYDTKFYDFNFYLQ